MVKFSDLDDNSSGEEADNRQITKPRRVCVFSSSDDDDEPCREQIQEANLTESNTEITSANSWNIGPSSEGPTDTKVVKFPSLKSRLITFSDIESDESEHENLGRSIIATVSADAEDNKQKHKDPFSDVEEVAKEENLDKETSKVGKCSGLNLKLITSHDIESDDSENEESNLNGPASKLPVPHDKIDKDNACNERKRENARKKNKKRPKKEVDPKLAIRSETQRMEREMPVNLPYHKPKQRSLREFLSRKKNEIKADSLRSSSHHMIRTWEEIDKSIKETAEFFKSESEDESEASVGDAEKSADQLEFCQIKHAPHITVQLEIENKSAALEKPAQVELENSCTQETSEMHTLENSICDPNKSAHPELNNTNDPVELPQLGLKNMSDEQVKEDESARNLATQTEPKLGSKEDLLKEQPNIFDVTKTHDLSPLSQEATNKIKDGGITDFATDPAIAINTFPNSILESNPCQPITGESVKNDRVGSTGTSSSGEKNHTATSDVEITSLGECSSKEKTGKWLEDIVTFERREILRKKLQLSPSVLNKVPTLSNETSAFVELDLNTEQGEIKTGARQLMERMFKCRQRLFRGPVSLTTTTAERDAAGHIKNISVETIPLTTALTTKTDNSKPGGKLQQLREKLRNEIEAKWEEEFMKRCPLTSEKAGFENDIENTEDFSEKTECETSSESESEPEEEDVEIKDRPRKFCAFGDSEAEESAEEGDEESGNSDRDEEDNEAGCDDSENGLDGGHHSNITKTRPEEKKDEELECSMLPAFQPGGGLLMGGSALTQQTQPLPFGNFSPASSPAIRTPNPWTPDAAQASNTRTPLLMNTPLTAKKRNPSVSTDGVKKNLFGANDVTPSRVNDTTPNRASCTSHSRPNLFMSPAGDDADDPFLFVSGAFPETPTTSVPVMEPSSHFIPKRILLPEDSDDSQQIEPHDNLDEAGDEKEKTENMSSLKEKEPDENEDPQILRVEQTITSTKKRIKKLAFSDDEGNDDDSSDDIESGGEENVVASEEPAQQSEEEDEEENPDQLGADDEVAYDSEENEVVGVRPGEFLEQEAELSESEWSGDEDEQGLDALEAEAGDADLLDEDQVASQLGRIHMRRLLDEDARDVRLLQELLFEDGDLHSDGKGRDRKFRWKNLAGFDAASGPNGEDTGNDVEDDGDGYLAKLRHEKTQFLLKLEQEGKLSQMEEELSQDGESLLQLGRQLLQRLQPRPATTSSDSTKSAYPRGSFLSKDDAFLSRLARASVGGSEAPLGPAHSRNFVFAAQEKEVVTKEVVTIKGGVKRKALGCQETVKRAKLAITLGSQPSLLDQLNYRDFGTK